VRFGPRRRGAAAKELPALSTLAATAAAILVACSSPGTSVAARSAGSTAPQTSASAAPSTMAPVSPSASAAASRTLRPSPSPGRTTVGPSAARVPVGGPYVTWVPLPAGCLTVGPAIVGVKVYLVQKALHLVGHGEQYDAATAAAVAAFQRAHSLAATAVVDAVTWAALGTGYPFCVDRYTQQPVVGRAATAASRVEAMIAYATSRVGTAYMWGGAGPIGFDCSGLVIQAMYAGGRVVSGLNTDLHVQASFRDTNYMYASALEHVPFSQRRRGDLVFYGSDLSHMAIYLGNGQIVEAVRPVIRIATLFADGLPVQPYVLRPFPS